MYAVIEDSGSQYKVGKGDVIRVDRRDITDETDRVEFPRVLMIGGDEPKFGTPYLEGAKVVADVLSEERDRKVDVIKFKRRQGYRRKIGHRQPFMKVRVTDIEG